MKFHCCKVRDVLAQDFIRRQYTAMNAFLMVGNSILPVNTKSCCENMDVTGMLPQLDILYVVGCFQMCKKIWEYKMGCNSALEWELKSAPSCVGIFICGERQKKNQRKNSKCGF